MARRGRTPPAAEATWLRCPSAGFVCRSVLPVKPGQRHRPLSRQMAAVCSRRRGRGLGKSAPSHLTWSSSSFFPLDQVPARLWTGAEICKRRLGLVSPSAVLLTAGSGDGRTMRKGGRPRDAALTRGGGREWRGEKGEEREGEKGRGPSQGRARDKTGGPRQAWNEKRGKPAKPDREKTCVHGRHQTSCYGSTCGRRAVGSSVRAGCDHIACMAVR
jgi:hypothetical protein